MELSEKGQTFLDGVQNGKHSRQQVTGLTKFVEGKVSEEMQALYSPDEITALTALQGTDRDVEARMSVKLTPHYFDRAQNSVPLQNLVKARPEETQDLAGQDDPSQQLKYSPTEGLLHKYEMALLYVITTCSAHCRYCYRSDVINQKEITKEDGSTVKKELANPDEIVQYITEHNQAVAENDGAHPDTGRPKLREVLLSGGDPMVLSNKNLATWMATLAEAGVETIRIGTKELAFYPDRFGENFMAMLDSFHETYPDVKLRFAVHFTHPDEFLQKDDTGQYIQKEGGGYLWHEDTLAPIQKLTQRGDWITLANQTPIIWQVNDNADAIRIMQRELKREGVQNHYFFQGREIEGHRAFNVPVEETWRIVNDSQKGLSGMETNARCAMSTVHGKVEVISVTDEPIPGVPGTENGFVVLKVLRSPEDAETRGKISIVGRNPEALWLTGYEDRVIYDEAGLFPGATPLAAPENASQIDQFIRAMQDMNRMFEGMSPDTFQETAEKAMHVEAQRARDVQNKGRRER